MAAFAQEQRHVQFTISHPSLFQPGARLQHSTQSTGGATGEVESCELEGKE